MIIGVLSPVVRSVSLHSRRVILSYCTISKMGHQSMSLINRKKSADFRLCNVSGHEIDLLEIRAPDPTLHVLFIPGNPGVISFYTKFMEYLYESLGGTASVTAIGHTFHTEKNREGGSLFSLQDQIDHKLSFIEDELKDAGVPIVLVGHSIGSYISIEIFKRCQEKVIYCIGLYPFLTVNAKSTAQTIIKKIAESPLICIALSSIVALLGMLPTWATRFLVKTSIGKSWSASAVDALCTHVLQYHTMRNVLFMAMTEFRKLSEVPDWAFMRGRKSQIAFLFGLDDHWGPLHLLEKISQEVPGAVVAVEHEILTHAFSCTEAGSLWVAQHIAGLINTHLSN